MKAEKNQVLTTDRLPSVWAETIFYLSEQETADGVVIYGIRSHRAAGRDPLQLYTKEIANKITGREPSGPHIEFANAEGPARRRFLERYGPFVATSDTQTPTALACPYMTEDAKLLQSDKQRLADKQRFEEARKKTKQRGDTQFHFFPDFSNYDTSVIAYQDFRTFDAERHLFRNVMRLMAYADRSAPLEEVSPLLSAIAGGTWAWMRQHKQECERRDVLRRQTPGWKWTTEDQANLNVWADDVGRMLRGDYPAEEGVLEGFIGGPPIENQIRLDHIEIAHCVISRILNAFPASTKFFYDGSSFVRTEILPADDRLFGCRAVFYGLLRLEYLSANSRLAICNSCGNWFRGRGVSCADCGRKQSQNSYWRRKGKFMRRKRLRKQKRSLAPT